MKGPTMTAKTARLAAAKYDREQLKTAYLLAFDNFATDAAEVAEALGIKPAAATKLLRAMENVLTTSLHVNDERKLTWQAMTTYDDIDRAEAERRFDEAYPPAEASAPSAPSHKGATGPRYTPEQLKKGKEARLEGKSWVEVAKAAGVKSDGHFSRVLRAEFPGLNDLKPGERASEAAMRKATAKKQPTRPAKPKKAIKARQPRRVKTRAKATPAKA
jgi:hypothetical protein